MRVLYGAFIFILIACASHSGANFGSDVNSSDQCEVLAKKRAALVSGSRKAKKAKWRTNSVIRRSSILQPANKTQTSSNEQTAFIVSPPGLTRPLFADALPVTRAIGNGLLTGLEESRRNPVGVVGKRPPIKVGKDKAVVDESEELAALPLSLVRYAYGLPIVIGCSALVAMSLLALFQERSKNLTRWAAANPWTARGIIAGAQFSSAGAMGLAGHYLHSHGYVVADLVHYASLTGLTASTLLYPDVSAKMYWTRTTYLRQKFHDVSVFASGAAIMLFVGNHYSVTTRPILAETHVVSFADFSPSLRTIKKQTPVTPVAQDPAKKKNHSKQVWLTVLASVGFTFLFLLVAALACEVSCAGSGAGAIAIFLVGEVGFAFLFAAVIRKIWGIQRKKKRQAAASPTQ